MREMTYAQAINEALVYNPEGFGERLRKEPQGIGLEAEPVGWGSSGGVSGRIHGVRLKVRQTQRWIRRLGFSLRQPIYRYAQATTEGVEEFRKTVKKTPDDQEK